MLLYPQGSLPPNTVIMKMKKIVKKFAVTVSHQPFISYGNRTKKQREKTWLYFVETFVYVVFYGKLHKKNTTASLWENSKKIRFSWDQSEVMISSCSPYSEHRHQSNSFLTQLGQHFRSSHRRCSVRKGALRNLTKFTGKHLFCTGASLSNIVKFLRTTL